MATLSEEMNSKSDFNNVLPTVGKKARDLLDSFRTRISEHQEDIKNIERELPGHAHELKEHNEHENCDQITKVSCDVASVDESGRHFHDSWKLKSLKRHLYSFDTFLRFNIWIWSDSMKYATFHVAKYPCILISKLVASMLFHLIQPPERCKKQTVRYGASDNLWISRLVSLIVILILCQGVDGRKVQEGKPLELRPNRSDAQESAWTFTPLYNTSVIKTLCRNGEETVAKKITPCPGFTCSSDRLQISNFQRCHEGSYTFSGAASCDDPECFFTEYHILTIDDADIAEASNSSEEANSSLPIPEQNSTSPVIYNANGRGFITTVMVGCILVPVILAIAAILYKFKLCRKGKKNTEHANSAQFQKMLGSYTEAEVQRNGLV